MIDLTYSLENGCIVTSIDDFDWTDIFLGARTLSYTFGCHYWSHHGYSQRRPYELQVDESMMRPCKEATSIVSTGCRPCQTSLSGGEI